MREVRPTTWGGTLPPQAIFDASRPTEVITKSLDNPW